MAEYGLSLDAAVWDFPLATALVLLPVYIERKSGDSKGPNYAQEAAITARNRCKAFLEEHYEIVDDPTLPWKLGPSPQSTIHQ